MNKGNHINNEEKSHAELSDLYAWSILTPEEMDLVVNAIQGVDPAASGFYYSEAFDKLYRLFSANGDMPYGIMKARTGDPEEWILEQMEMDLNW